MNLDVLIRAIADGAYGFANVFNPWRDRDPLDVEPHPDAQRRERLARHFDCKPKYLLIGEAPGYQGCRFSGVPFTNESLLTQGAIPRLEDMAGKRITSRDRPWSEPSATVMWRTLHELRLAQDVVLWNAFAWHPHEPGDPLSNRAPTGQELEAGSRVLKAVCAFFDGAQIVAVGRVAERALVMLGLTPHLTVRHPSMGGAKAFAEGLRLCQLQIKGHMLSPAEVAAAIARGLRTG